MHTAVNYNQSLIFLATSPELILYKGWDEGSSQRLTQVKCNLVIAKHRNQAKFVCVRVRMSVCVAKTNREHGRSLLTEPSRLPTGSETTVSIAQSWR